MSNLAAINAAATCLSAMHGKTKAATLEVVYRAELQRLCADTTGNDIRTAAAWVIANRYDEPPTPTEFALGVLSHTWRDITVRVMEPPADWSEYDARMGAADGCD